MDCTIQIYLSVVAQNWASAVVDVQETLIDVRKIFQPIAVDVGQQ